jgi:hypothetical protein
MDVEERDMGRPEELRAEAQSVLALLEPLGSLSPTGSYVSGLMVRREVDVMLLGGPDYTPADVLTLLGRAVEIPGVTAFAYADERGHRSPTGESRDERFHVTLTAGEWEVDLSIWLNDDHANVTEWHRALADRLTDEERQAILAIKSVWHERAEYPGSFAVYTAVLEHGVRTAVEFGVWLRAGG